MQLVFQLSYFEPVQNLPTWIVVLLFFVPFVGGLILYFYKTRHARLWRKGIYPPNLKLTQDNLLEAYLALGSVLILLDYNQAKGKTQFINQYFNRYFKSSNYNFADSLLFSMNHPIQIDTVCDWLNKNLETEGERSQVVYFLTGLALLNEKLSDRELKFLQLMNSKLHLPKENLERIIAIFKSYYSSRKETEEKSSRKAIPRKDKRLEYSNILNINKNASKDELKKAYRKLVKLHHPDVFANASEAQQNLAKEKFQKIQEAYEYLSDEI